MKRRPFIFIVFGQFLLCKLEGWTSSSSLIIMPRTEAGCSRSWHMSTSVFEALMVQFPASLAGSRIIIKDAPSLCAGEHCTVLFPMSLNQEGLWHYSTADNSQWLLRGVLEAIWLPQWNHGQRGQMFERNSREESSAQSSQNPPLRFPLCPDSTSSLYVREIACAFALNK